MNIKGRLKTIEGKIKINHSQFCACEDSPRVEIAIKEDDVKTIQNPIADFCERCRKPIEKRRIIIELIERRDQVTKE